jgi:hypothetical protein
VNSTWGYNSEEHPCRYSVRTHLYTHTHTHTCTTQERSQSQMTASTTFREATLPRRSASMVWRNKKPLNVAR